MLKYDRPPLAFIGVLVCLSNLTSDWGTNAWSFDNQPVAGDGRCDPQLNNQAHQWDDGDCCPGTCRDGAVYACAATPATCLAALDPQYAAEQMIPCLFLHGAGRRGPTVPIFSDDHPEAFALARAVQEMPYWGYDELQFWLTGVCREVIFAQADTSAWDWTISALQRGYYQKAKSVLECGGVVFAHSMANLLLGGACVTHGHCNVRWYNIGGPFQVDYDDIPDVFQRLYQVGERTTRIAQNILPWANATLANVFGDVTEEPKFQIRMFLRDHPDKARMVTQIRNRRLVLGSLCGTSAIGSLAVKSTRAELRPINIKMMMRQLLVENDPQIPRSCRQTDGFVGVCGCFQVAAGERITADPQVATRNWAVNINHSDLIGRWGMWEDQPVYKWYIKAANHARMLRD